MNQITATGKACVPTYKIYKKEEFGKMLLQDNRDKMETNQRTAVVEFSKLFRRVLLKTQGDHYKEFQLPIMQK